MKKIDENGMIYKNIDLQDFPKELEEMEVVTEYVVTTPQLDDCSKIRFSSYPTEKQLLYCFAKILSQSNLACENVRLTIETIFHLKKKEPFQIVLGYFPNNPEKEYSWKNAENLDVKPGDRVLAETKYGDKMVCVSKVVTTEDKHKFENMKNIIEILEEE